MFTPSDEKSLGRALGAAHRRWLQFVNARGRWTGHLFDGRFASVAMDDDHLMAAVRYVALNPVRARLAAKAEDWPWSSVRKQGADGVPVADICCKAGISQATYFTWKKKYAELTGSR